MHLALRGLETELREMADTDGIVMLSNRSIASKLNIGQRQINEMITELVEEGLVHKTRGLLRINGSVKDPNGSVKESNGSVTDARHDKTLRDSKNSKKHESPKSLNGFEFKEESSSSSSARAKNWLDRNSDDDDDDDFYFRELIHRSYRLEGRHSAELLREARIYFQEHFVGNSKRMDDLVSLLQSWQDQWSKPGQLDFKPSLKRFLEDVVLGGKFSVKPI